MDAHLMAALADILADALLADLETEMEEEQAVAVSTANPRRELAVGRTSCSPSRASHQTPLSAAVRAIPS
jgi:hypothetical protein